ncbi:MAG: carbamate kinase [Actinomycetia bacterium]|nr:carbamate kinase [Actinomycetes bacterium]
MRVVVALGGNALLRRGERPDAEPQRRNVLHAAESLVALAAAHELIVTHGNGPQVGVLAVESASDPMLTRPFPLDHLGAETQGLIGYWLAQALRNAMPARQVAAVLTQCVVVADDPAFDKPTKFVGPTYDEATARRLAEQQNWTVTRDGDYWRRVVASPEPHRIVESETIRMLTEAGVLVVCAGGGGVPVIEVAGELRGVEAVIDKDLTAALLAEVLAADALLLLTDVVGVESDFGRPDSQVIRDTTPSELRARTFPAGSMGPKVDAACRFVERTGGVAAIGSLTEAATALAGTTGTFIHR